MSSDLFLTIDYSHQYMIVAAKSKFPVLSE